MSDKRQPLVGFLRRIDLKCMSTCHIWCLIAPIWSFEFASAFYHAIPIASFQSPWSLSIASIFVCPFWIQYLVPLLLYSSPWLQVYCTITQKHKKSEVFCLGIHDNLLRVPTSIPNPSTVVIEKWLVTQKSRASWWPPCGCVSKSNYYDGPGDRIWKKLKCS